MSTYPSKLLKVFISPSLARTGNYSYVYTAYSLLRLHLPHRLVKPLLIRLLVRATLAAPDRREKKITENLHDTFEKTFYRHIKKKLIAILLFIGHHFFYS